MLACLPEEEIDCLYPDELLPARTPYTITSKKALLDALADARDKGYACDDQESDLDIWAVASCIRNHKGYPIAALSVVAPIFRIQNKNYAHWYQSVRKSAFEISSRLGYRSS
jgi:DNA-binding IclR family transcriptional regulator